MKSVFDFDPNLSTMPQKGRNLFWRDAKDSSAFGLYGSDALGETGYARLTEAERNVLRPVNDGEAWLAEQSAGIQLRFRTDSSQVFIRVKIRSKFDMTNMTQIGQCGGDLYVYDETLKTFVLHDVARYAFDGTEYELSMSRFANAPRKMRRFLYYFPLYMAVDSFEIGLDDGAFVAPEPFSTKKRIAVYGTSITQGCSASRPGMASTNMLSRDLDTEVLNFGFSGCAFMEEEMGDILGKRKNIDLLIVDTEANAGIDDRMERNSEKFFNAFFAHRPDVPVVVYSRVMFSLDLYDDFRARLREYYKGFLNELAAKYRREGRKMYYADGSKILGGNFTEYYADGIHPTDTGMRLIADSYREEIRKIWG